MVTSNLPIIKKSTGVELVTNSGRLFISNHELVSHGCKNCVWRLHNQCCHNLVKDSDVYEFNEQTDSGSQPVVYSGYCPEYAQFLLSFAEDGDSISSVWEKFSLYVGRMQSLEDYKSYINLQNEIDAVKNSGIYDYNKLQDLEMKKSMLRLFWIKLQEMVIKGYSKIVDREYRLKDVKSNMPGIMNAKVINFNTIQQIDKKESVKELESKNE